MALALAGLQSNAQVITLGIPIDTPVALEAAGSIALGPNASGSANYTGPNWTYVVSVNNVVGNPIGTLVVQHLTDAGTGITPGPVMGPVGGSLMFPINLSGSFAHGWPEYDTFDFFMTGTIAGSGAMTGEWILTAAHVPEPQHYALAAGLGLMAFGAYRRFRKA